jgi:tartrate dehydratase beta subunit/fumarate hydratase class I family protein
MINECEYSITEKNKVAIMVFKGKMSKGANEIIDQCRKDFLALDVKFAVIYFKDVEVFHPVAFRELTCLQQEIRKKEIPLSVVGLNYENKKYLLDRAVIRLHETKKDLEEALLSITRIVA